MYYHEKCLTIPNNEYMTLSNCNELWFCIKCIHDALPFYLNCRSFST